MELEVDEVVQRVHEARRGELVAHLPALALGTHQTAPAEAGEVVGDVGATDADGVGQVGGVGRAVEELHEDPAAGGIGEGGAHPLEGVEAHRQHGHARHDTSKDEFTAT